MKIEKIEASKQNKTKKEKRIVPFATYCCGPRTSLMGVSWPRTAGVLHSRSQSFVGASLVELDGGTRSH